METGLLVIKVGGNELDQEGFVTGLAQAVAALRGSQPCIVVHGGGRVINDLLSRLEIVPSFYEGQRVTDQATLDVVEMVLSGRVNKNLVLALTDAGVDALGVSGVDLSLLQVEPWAAELGSVGRITQVKTAVLRAWLEEGIVPVISPIARGPGGRYNVNADHAAGAIAAAMSASQLVFVSNVPGVMVDGRVLSNLTPTEVRQHIETGKINGGMIPKTGAALDALAQGVSEVLITNLAGLKSLSGTHLINSPTQESAWKQ